MQHFQDVIYMWKDETRHNLRARRWEIPPNVPLTISEFKLDHSHKIVTMVRW